MGMLCSRESFIFIPVFVFILEQILLISIQDVYTDQSAINPLNEFLPHSYSHTGCLPAVSFLQTLHSN